MEGMDASLIQKEHLGSHTSLASASHIYSEPSY